MMDKRMITPDMLREALGEPKRETVPPEIERVVPPELLERLLSGEVEEEDVVLELERLGWKQVGHLFIAK